MSRRETGDAAEEAEAVIVLHSSRSCMGMMAEPDTRSAETTEQSRNDRTGGVGLQHHMRP